MNPLPSKFCVWQIKDNLSRLRLDVKGLLDDAVCAHQDWLEAVEAMNKLKYERMKVLSDTEMHDALAKIWHTTSASPNTRSRGAIWDLWVHFCSG